jgi:hypothetical protein
MSDLTEIFMNMHETRLKVTPDKYVFGVTKGKNARLFGFDERKQSQS